MSVISLKLYSVLHSFTLLNSFKLLLSFFVVLLNPKGCCCVGSLPQADSVFDWVWLFFAKLFHILFRNFLCVLFPLFCFTFNELIRSFCMFSLVFSSFRSKFAWLLCCFAILCCLLSSCFGLSCVSEHKIVGSKSHHSPPVSSLKFTTWRLPTTWRIRRVTLCFGSRAWNVLTE